ncbi:MAG TPA: cadherin repeat domain-containing protein [Desulfobacterales bacterium]|nr:cadherin repeat domain-containing protein [Desulfobacterales bacterium]
MHIEWQYDTSLPGLAGFRIYQDGQLIHEIPDPSTLAADITVTFSGDAAFTMTAYDTDGVESPPSDPYLVRYSDINTAPQASGGSFTVAEDAALSDTVAASDADGDSLTYTVVSQPAHGALSLDAATGAFTYTPEADFSGSDAFVFTVSDGWASSPPATVALTVTGVNDPPAAQAASLATNEDTSLAGSLSATDPDGDSLTFAVSGQPAHGALSLDAATGAFTYTPDADFSGADTFSFTVSDGEAVSTPATVEITVNEVNDPPVAAVSGPAGKVAPGAAVILDGSGSRDADDGIAAVAWRQIGGPAVQLAGGDSLQPTFTAPAQGPRGVPLVFELTVTDNGGLTATATVSVQVGWPLPSPTIQVLAARR